MSSGQIISSTYPSYLVSNVWIWNENEDQKNVDVLVEHGSVKAITPHGIRTAQNLPTINGNGYVLMPAGVDAQVHLRVPGQRHKETPESGLWAAVAGGVGALLTMPNTKPVLDEPSVLELARAELSSPIAKTNVEVLYSAAMTKGQKGRECVDFQALAKAGVAAFTDDGVGVPDDEVMLNILKGGALTRLPLLQHAEVPGHGAVLAEGPLQKELGIPPYLDSIEVDMVVRDLRLLEQVKGAKYHVLHVSSAKTLEVIQAAKSKNLAVTCEVSPHHLFFTSNDIVEGNTSFKMNPPLRGAQDRKALREALANGICDFMATDHAPHETEVKSSNFKTSAFGTTGLETSLRVLLDLWRQGLLSQKRLVEVWSTAPAKFLGIDSRFGKIAVGFPFHAVLCDVAAPERLVATGDFLGLSKNSCFINSRLPGRILATFLRDKLHFQEHKLKP